MADYPKDSSLDVSMDILKTNTLKTHTDPHTVRGRQTLNDVEHFRNCLVGIVSKETGAASVGN